jgi:hypothetical protein
MVQNANAQKMYAKNPSGAYVPALADAAGRLETASQASDASTTLKNITVATVVKATPGTVISFTVVVAGAAGTINDCATTGAAAAANQIATTPAAVGNTQLNFPCSTGIVVVPGAGQTIAINYE